MINTTLHHAFFLFIFFLLTKDNRINATRKTFSPAKTMQTSKTAKKYYLCTTCNKSLTAQRYLTAHIRLHTGEKPFPCNKCNKRFITESRLKRHVLMHTWETPFPCNQCNKDFATEYALNRHMLTHTEEKSLPCNECNKSFITQEYLTLHKRMHTKDCVLTYEQCNNNFPTEQHMLENNGDNITFPSSLTIDSLPVEPIFSFDNDDDNHLEHFFMQIDQK